VIQAVLEATSDPAVVFTREANVIDANAAAAAALEAESVEEMRGSAFEAFTVPEDKNSLEVGKKLLLDGERGEFIWAVAGKKGGWRRLKSRVLPLPRGPAEVGASMIIAQQISGFNNGELLASIVGSAHDAIVACELDGTIVGWNPAAERLFGFTSAEAVGKNVVDLIIPPQCRDQALETIGRVARGEGPFYFDAQRQKEDGTLRDVSVSAFGVRDQAGRLVGIAAILHDVTESRRAERKQAFLAAIVESSQTALIGITADRKIASWNRAAESAYGYSAEEIVGQPFNLLVPEGEPDASKVIARVLRGEAPGLHEAKRRCKDGRIALVSVTESPIRDKAGNIFALASSERSILEETRLRQELQQAHAYARAQVESSIDAMVTIDQNLVILDVNEQMARLTGVPKAMLIGSRFDRCFTEPERAAAGVRTAIKRAL